MRINVLTFILAASLVAWCGRAEEEASGHYVPGVTADFMDALPNDSGLAAVNLFTFYNGGAGVNEPFDFAGRLTFGVEGTVYADTLGLLYKTPLQILGGNYAALIAIPIVSVEVKAQTEFSGPRGGLLLGHNLKDTASGLGDITIYPIIWGWKQFNGDLKEDLRFGIYAPTGSYTTGDLANAGRNFWTFEPSFSISWLSSKIGTEISLFSGFDFNTENDATQYQSGAVFHLDATVAQHLPLSGGFIGVGANVFYYQQITADGGSGAKLGSFEGTTTGIGPVLSYARKFGKVDVVGEVKWLPELSVDKRLKGDYLWVKLGVVF